MSHTFGGEWTEKKLAILRRYLGAYTTALQNKGFSLVFIDAFAGTGSRAIAAGDGELFEVDTSAYADLAKGSSRIALEITPPFQSYVFIEKRARHLDELEQAVRAEYAQLAARCNFIRGDANAATKSFIESVNKQSTRGVIFLDPYGTQLDWETLKRIAATGILDVWYLFPTAMGIGRMTPHGRSMPRSWEDRLDRLLGDRNWRSRFYVTTESTDLFGANDVQTQRTASIGNIEAYVIERLKTIFPEVAPKGLTLGRPNMPMYTLYFACSSRSEKAKLLARKLAAAALKGQ
ncbi:MAG: three-Cys-motif partner protein TcmP [Alphaproteobacteria bacterium]